MDENRACQNETSPQAAPSTSMKRIKLAPLLIALVIIVLSFGCLILFWNITSLTLAYPNAALNEFNWKPKFGECGDYGRMLSWVSSIKFSSKDDAGEIKRWYQQQGLSDYVGGIYKGVKGGGLMFEQDWLMLHTVSVKSVFIDQSENSTQIELRTVVLICVFGN